MPNYLNFFVNLVGREYSSLKWCIKCILCPKEWVTSELMCGEKWIIETLKLMSRSDKIGSSRLGVKKISLLGVY